MDEIAHYRKRLKALESERSNLVTLWQELSDYIIGYRGRFLAEDRNKAQRNTNILNNTGRLAARTLASGMMAGITSPARPWFKLSTMDPDMADYGPVKSWLHDVEIKMRDTFAQSNVYNCLHSLYSELGVFGTGSMGVYSDYDTIIRCVPYTAGSYMIATNGKHQVDTFYRKYQMTIAQAVKEFGVDNVSLPIRQQWERGNTEAWLTIIHAIEPADDADKQKKGRMPWRSVYFEERTTGNQALARRGFDDFPILAPRWELAGDDIYGTSCPGMDALGDIKVLQLHERRKSQAIDKLVDPPMQAPLAMKSQMYGEGFLPGELAFVPDTSAGIRSIYDFKPDLGALAADIQQDEYRVKRAFYEDLFLMLANTDRRQITAREIEEKHEEKLLMLGPVLERLHNELLNPLIKRTFSLMSAAHVLPVPPPELQGTEVNVDYISVLAQAQRLTAVTGIERVSTFAANLAQIWPEARHKLDPTQAVDEYAQAVGVSPHMIRDDEEVESRIMQEQQAAQQQQMAEMMPAAAQGASAAKALSETDVDSASALTRAMGLA
jgi:hypothetical protein